MSQSPVITVLATALCLTFLAESREATMFEPQRLPMRAEEFEIARRRMLAEISARAVQLRDTTGRAAFDERVMAAMGRVPRHEFVPIEFQSFAYANIPLPIGFDKTISQPYVVSLWLLDRTHGASSLLKNLARAKG